MPAFRNSVRFRLLGLMLNLGIIWTSSVVAQQSGPVTLVPPKRFVTSPTETSINAVKPDMVQVPGYKAGSVKSTVGGSGIVVDPLQAVTANSIGIFTAEKGGFGQEMWRGTSMTMAENMLITLPARNGSATLFDLIRRIMLSAAEPPKGKSDGEQFAVLRIRRLADMANYSAALNLLSLMPRHGRGEGLLRAETEIRLLSNDQGAACQLVENEVRRNQANFWQKALVFCQVLSRELEKAELGLTLLREVGVEDPNFYGLARALFDGKVYEVADLKNLSPLVLAMLSNTKFTIQPAMVSELAPNALRVVAFNKNVSLGPRAIAVEKMAQLGMYSDEVIVNLYKKIITNLSLTETKADNSQSPSLEQRALQRAQFYVAAIRSKIPLVKAEAASQAFELAAADGVIMGTARLFKSELEQIPISMEMLWFAVDGFRAAVVNAEEERSQAWLSVMRRAAALSDEKSRKLKSIIPLALILNDGDKGPYGAILSTGEDPSRMVLLHALLSGLGHGTPPEKWITWFDPTTKINPIPFPHASIWFALRGLSRSNAGTSELKRRSRAKLSLTGAVASSSKPSNVSVPEFKAPQAKLDNGVFGKAASIMLLIQAMGGHEPHAQNPIVLAEIIRNLYMLGLKTEARNLALEAALGAGL